MAEADTQAAGEQTGLDPERVSELAQSGQAQLVDVRGGYEHEAGHIAGGAHIPLADLNEETADLDRSRAVIFYCRSGERSGMAAAAFKESGWDASSMAGGLLAWAERGLPLEPEDGEVAERSHLPGA